MLCHAQNALTTATLGASENSFTVASIPCHERLAKATAHVAFRRVVIVVILLSCIELGFESAENLSNPEYSTIFFVFDVIFTGLFGIEALLKITAVSGLQKTHQSPNIACQ